MKAAFLTINGFEIRDVKLPEIKKDEVIIKTAACGVCSGDVFVYQHRSELAAVYPRLGHEASGEVVAVGKGVADFQPGDLVTSLSLPAYAEYFVSSAAQLVKLPPDVEPVYALGEAIACCVHASNRFCIQPGAKVAIVGCGFMGLVCQQIAREIQGAGFICSFDPIAERREMSRHFGASATHDPAEISVAEVLAAHGEFEIVIEAAGTQSALDLATALVSEHGRIILVGYHQSNAGVRTVNMQQWNYKAIDVANGHVRRQDEKLEAMRQGVELIRQGAITPQPLVTAYEFSEIESAFQDLTKRKPNLFKAVLRMN